MAEIADPIAVVLARIEVKLDNTLTELGKHASTLDRHTATLEDYGNRLTTLETIVDRDDANSSRAYSGKTVLWTAIGAIVAALSLAVIVILAVKGGGG